MQNSKRLTSRTAMLITALVLGALAGGQALMTASGMRRPANTEFGLGPRSSANGMFTATLVPVEPLRPRKLYTIPVVITDANNQPIDNAEIAIDGGMPQHGHGLPTRPRATTSRGSGRYDLEGVRFNMGGWWEFKLWITTPAGRDLVTFNLGL